MSARSRVVGVMVLACMAFVAPAAAQEATPAVPEGCAVVADGLAHPRDLAYGPDGTIYAVVDDDTARTIAAISEDGTVATLGEGLPLAPADTAPSGLAVSPNGDVWMLHNGGVSRLLDDGSPEAFGPISGATGIAVDTDGRLIVAIGAAGQVLRCDVVPEFAGVPEVTISLQDVFFEPNEVTIPANTDVTIHIVNDGFAFHNFAIPAAGASTPQLGNGGTEDLVVNLPPGDYEIVCEVRGHEGAGMVGILHVTG